MRMTELCAGIPATRDNPFSVPRPAMTIQQVKTKLKTAEESISGEKKELAKGSEQWWRPLPATQQRASSYGRRRRCCKECGGICHHGQRHDYNYSGCRCN